ncbi:23S rRNA (uracil(1939)-C(5))-methyltransferase RlmD [Colwellia sp. UCD-KL20]|uniref:23S rRNA (uracil(1939)-C(5))-methyltransferase RlmD n=1 Tax=Colwellia sp. UCD-KL20 TaxID=1917165 RepID=UPI000970B516|nr:23S rRNA (uracil(1939)-C(5))-methyltransferase RlmD [Colwellia sp. UCD-KL20]
MANFFKPSTKKQPTGQVISVLIDRLDHNGIGVGEYKNKSIFIANTLPKEKVTAKIAEAKSKFYKASVIELVNLSEFRVKPRCHHFKTCGGCDLQHLSFQEHLAFKQQKLIDLFSRNNINTNLPWQESITSDALHYRRKARVGVQYNKLGEPIVGFRQKASNNLVQLKECIVLVEPIKHVFTILTSLIKSLSLVKSIGHVEIIYTQHVSIIVRQLIPLNEQDKTLWKNIAEQHQWQVYIDNGKEVTPLTPVTPLFYQISEQSGISTKHAAESVINIYFEPKDFIQVNHHVNNQMIIQALNWLDLKEDDQVLDLFCGLGNFSLPIAKKVRSVVGIEGLQAMVDKATYNAQMSKLNNIEFFQADLNSNWGKEAWAHRKYSKVLLDPARAGAYGALVQLIDLDISNIVYVSCDPATLAKDSQLLISNGYTIEKIAIMDMFAQTKHIETMILFKK